MDIKLFFISPKIIFKKFFIFSDLKNLFYLLEIKVNSKGFIIIKIKVNFIRRENNQGLEKA